MIVLALRFAAGPRPLGMIHRSTLIEHARHSGLKAKAYVCYV